MEASQSFDWEEYGLKLQVPSQSLPSNINRCAITIAASLCGQYQFSDDVELVSPVFWLRCNPSIKFKVPLRLEIEHCAPLKNSSNLFMARASSTQKDLPYSFEVLETGSFTKHSTYGAIDLNKFSGLGVVQKGSKERRYWYNVFYMGPLRCRNIHFTVTWHNEAHITVSLLSGLHLSAWVGMMSVYVSVQKTHIKGRASYREGVALEFSLPRKSFPPPTDFLKVAVPVADIIAFPTM